ncbi:ABC transporter [Melaminivora suipulveris]|uniref:ABC transporter n=1 Tax=Melaminivora suipulveris TaxID=2109913 RepID=A0A2R3QA91_9BURK|nr:ABC transporter transmembrane domain-containing protein [Melaminivora suipulveris]AVO48696.1 ABC transporter [Melaminivora suipulveris]
MQEILPSTDTAGLPGGPLAALAQAALAPGENVLAAFEVDLAPTLRFAPGLLVLTGQRLLALGAEAAQQGAQFWPLAPGLRLQLLEHGGVGTLELHDPQRRLALWRFTLGQEQQAVRLQQRFERQLERLQRSSQIEEAHQEAPRCPACHTPLPPGADECPTCARQQPPAASTWVLLRLWRFARPYKRQLGLGFGLTLASTAASLVPPYMTIPLMDEILIPYQSGQQIPVSQVALYLGGLLLAALLAWGLGWARTYVLALVSERIGADLRTTTYEHLMRLSLDYFGSKRTGDLMARIGSETDRINVFLSLNALDFATDVLMILMTSAILFSINPWLALVTLVPLPFIAWLIHTVRDKLRTGFERIDRVWSEVTNVLADTIPGIRVVKAFAQERREAERFRAANQHNLEVNDRLNKTWSLFSPTVSLMTEIGLLIVWAFGIWLVAKNQITVGVLTAFIAYIGRFYTRLDSMSRIVSVTQKAAAGAKRIFDILDHVSNVPDPASPVRVEQMHGAIELRGVGLRATSRMILKGVSLNIRPGEMIGLVGHSGSGKSTLVNLICRFYDVSEGAILVDGVDLRRMAVADYRSHIGLVLQEPFLFFGTVAENIAYGKPDATRDEIVAAARAAHAHEFILRLPHGYDSLVGERGQSLSGGERQRISIARALLIDPRILILDEATSAVDTETEREIQKALDNLVKGRTTIAIAHRLSTLRKADRLVVLDRGEIVEVGPHDQLMESQGPYWRLYEAQARRAEEDAQAAGLQIATPHSRHPAGKV